MLQVDMSASTRESFGKGAMRRLRVSGNTPAVLYGNSKENVSLQLETAPFLKRLHEISRKNAVVNLSIDGGDTRHVMMREIQTDPVDDALIHADFLEISLDVPNSYVVSLEFTGVPKGVDKGGELIIHKHAIAIEGLPLDIPDVLTIDVSDLDMDENLLFAGVALPENVTMTSDGTVLCLEVISANAAAARVAAESAAADAAAQADDAAVAEAADGGAAAPEVPVEGEEAETESE